MNTENVNKAVLRHIEYLEGQIKKEEKLFVRTINELQNQQRFFKSWLVDDSIAAVDKLKESLLFEKVSEN